MPLHPALYKPGPAHLLALAVSFAMVGVCTAIAFEGGANPLAVVTLRSLGTVALFLLYFLFAGVSLRLPRREQALAIAIGLPLCVNNYLINMAIAEIPVPLAVLIFYLWPAITSAATWLLGKAPFTWRGLLGLAFAFAGVALALNVDFTAAQAKGVGYAVGAAFLWSFVFLLIHHFFEGRDTRPATFYMTATAATVFVLASLLTGDFVLPGSPRGWAGAAGTALFYAVGMIGIFWAIGRLGPMRVGFFMNFEPIAAVLLAALILGQTLAPVQLAGAALVVAALFLFRPAT